MMLDMNIMEDFDKVESIAVVAKKEHSLEKQLKAMMGEWGEIAFLVKAYKDTGTFVIGGTDDITMLLDDQVRNAYMNRSLYNGGVCCVYGVVHGIVCMMLYIVCESYIRNGNRAKSNTCACARTHFLPLYFSSFQIVKIQTMLGSSSIKPIKTEAKAFEHKLIYLQTLVDEWLAVQRTWMYLEPIFSSDDIMRQMPTEGRRFKSVDAVWRTALAEAFEDPSVMTVAENDKLLGKFQEATKKLDIIQKGLNDYLETKRLVFPRFFFLSNDELLEILSSTKDVRAVKPFLGKCFEGMASIVFRLDKEPETEGTDKGQVILEMMSGEGEVVPLHEVVDPNVGKKKGNVEIWLLELESQMRLTVKHQVKESMVAYAGADRNQWVMDWPGAVVLCISGLYWTSEVEDALTTSGFEGIVQYKETLHSQLRDIVALVRGKISKMARRSLGALTVIDVHGRDVVDDMVEQKISDKNDFLWVAQLRYYWQDKDDDYNRYGSDPHNLLARIINAEQMYGYEYLGNSSRLIITPLTDRCYRTLMGAVSLMYGGAPAGPAGTGKTETVKDLSKACAIQCVVMNCSDGLDFLAMAKFFKGLAQSGAWACFDEFNRIDLEVLSVIAQQILTIQKTKRERVARFMFEGTNLSLNPDCNCFITMNPGYAGRSELPDNLQALFRPCAMMVPNYAMIAEIKLYSFGFENGLNLARKLTQVLTLSSELLSTQKHYDYGMRAVFSILVRAGALRQSLGDTWTEEWIVFSAILDVNLPKFNSADLPLFRGITTDLFPGVELPKPDYGELIPEIVRQVTAAQLQPTEGFIGSIVQLYETVQVRHGLMVVGSTMAGKSGVFNTLAKSMTSLDDFDNVKMHIMNPKSVSSNQLYGAFDANTHEWSDGILAILYRTASKDHKDRNWVLFDGPVDAVWIENMNTVLDDNKKLCLVSGEIIKMSPTMTMMFEAEDLEEASPATVSRVGMVFMEPSRLGPEPLLQSWLQFKLPESLEKHKEFVEGLFHWLFEPVRYYLRSNCKIPTPITDMELAKNVLVMFGALIHSSFVAEGGARPKEKDLLRGLECVFITALIWSLGVVANNEGRKRFDDLLRRVILGTIAEDDDYKIFLLKNPHYSPGEEPRIAMEPIPEDGLVYDHTYDIVKGRWVSWESMMKSFKVAADTSYSSILVPTLDTVRNGSMCELLVHLGIHIMLTGDTGTGKTVQVKQLLTEILDNNIYVPLYLNFSAQTSANQTQDIIDGKLVKRRKGIYGPPPQKKCVVFVDDLNMPKKETYGAQPPIEILRQWMDHRGWYDRKEQTFKKLIDLQFIVAMGPPGGGRTFITQRYVRHFHMINLVPFDDGSLNKLFQSIMDWHMLKGFAGKIKGLAPKVVEASIALFNETRRCMLPTPLKSHYTFNLRDLSKVFQGFCLIQKEDISGPDQVARLWVHECQRVFQDRLVDEHDRGWFQKTIEDMLPQFFQLKWKQVAGNNEMLIYGNYIDPRTPVEKRRYVEIEDHEKLQKVMTDYLEDYNAVNTKRMNLVLFEYAVDHLSRIARVIQLPGGNALLVGLGGSGRKSLCALAAFLGEMTPFSIEISKQYGMVEWHDDLKVVFRMAGVEKKDVVFLFSDTQVVLPGFVEDINNILNTGEVPNIWEADEKMMLFEDIGKDARDAGVNDGNPTEMMTYFVERVKAHLHLVLAFSPIGETFRQRLLMFPALVNCCTIDWFTAWPQQALLSVATTLLNEVELEDSVKKGVIDTCVDMQHRVREMSGRFLQSMGRYYYVTPTSYLELMKTFKQLIDVQRGSVFERRARYANGLQKLQETEAQVEGMEEELTALQPKLKEASIATDAKLVQVSASQEVAAVEKGKVEIEEKACNEQAAVAGAQKAECEGILAEAIPILEAAVAALKTLNKSDIVEVKNLKKPPKGVVVTMEAICIMFGKKAKRIKDPEGGTGKVDDYWECAQKEVLADTKFLQSLFDFDKDNVPQKIIDKVTVYTKREDFTPERITKASVAAAGLCKWVHAIVSYDRVAKLVAPKRADLAKATSDLAAAKAALAIKQAQLKEVLDQLAILQAELDETMAKKEELAASVEDCANKLARATKLIGGLGGEKVRWTHFVDELQVTYDNIVGDILLASGAIAYLGVFTSSYRDEAITAWSDQLRSAHITCAKVFDLTVVLGEPVEIRQWTINKLPNDSFSISNAIMLQNSDRWPLMIDPQGQANKWVRQTFPENLKVVKQSQSDFVRTLENAIQFGSPVLLENVPENLDPVLETILTKQVVKVGGVAQIQVGDNTVEYDEAFKLFITTKIPNPHYPPETCVKVNLLNFMATQEGLEDQMLGITVLMETPALAEKREQIVLQDAENKKELKDIEDTILRLLKEATGNILDDNVLITTLSDSKIKSDEINVAVKEAQKVSEVIDKTRRGFKPIAFRVSSLYFCIRDLTSVDPMYQYSLEWYINLYLLAIRKAEASAVLEDRLQSLSDTFTSVLYQNICRSLFEKDKLLFSMLLCFKIMTGVGTLDATELRYFLQGNATGEASAPNPCVAEGDHPQWLSDFAWAQVTGLEEMKAFQARGASDAFASMFAADLDKWQAVFEGGANCEAMVEEMMPDSKGFTRFHRLITLKCIRPDATVPAVMHFIKENIGAEFIDPPPFDVKACYDDSSCISPLIFVLTPGADPMTVLGKLADDLGFSKKLFAVSLGQGQGPIAEKAINLAVDKGTWVCLQNVHLLPSWMQTLERLCEEFSPDLVHQEFRLWLTSMPSDKFPVLVLQNSVKMTLEPPKGIRSNMQGSFVALDPDWFETCSTKPNVFRKMCFGVCFFHAVMRERCKFGPIGWNIPYTFSAADLRITIDQLVVFLDTYDDIPFDTLCYLTSDCNYGGRVTDDKDRRYINRAVTDYYNEGILRDDYKFSPSGTYFAPSASLTHAGHLDFIRDLPYNEGPEAFGLHDNAGITCAQQGTQVLLDTALSLQPKTSGGEGKSWGDRLDESAKSIEARLPEIYDIEKVSKNIIDCIVLLSTHVVAECGSANIFLPCR